MSRMNALFVASLFGLCYALKQRGVNIVDPDVATDGMKATAGVQDFLAASEERDVAWSDSLNALKTAPGTYPSHLIKVRERQEGAMKALADATDLMGTAADTAQEESEKAEEKYGKKKDKLDEMRSKEDFEDEAAELKRHMTVP
eukprot:gnl/TRDRNA2_/TRDRNA2_188623_c0_seq1.p1 gnl/TRDRNA2_/TRDRNA2_188623_c0~~gnl/TRDRNA2_/TRDRNA2_188623_c0_seq1.p1  ORF type:complete len:144 (-),score=42.49 gnl/TRDRNA2_/TRDRNA2_188623_c0_seq1:89-520(-)